MDLSLHILLDPHTIGQDNLADSVAAMAAGGATVIQMRGKDATTRELMGYGSILQPLCHKLGLLFIVNDRIDLALALQADGVHVGQDDMPIEAVRRIAPNMIVGLSAGSCEDITRQATCPPDYFGIGPVFSTQSKNDAGPAIGIDHLHRWTILAHQMAPVVAIGGISVANALQIWDAGVDGMAVISAVSGAKNKQWACAALRACQKREE